MKTRESIEATQSTQIRVQSASARERQLRGLKPWKPGQSGNPGGRPKQDISQLIARAIFENNPELIYKAYGKLLAKGSAFGFQVVAERAYGKLKETRDTGSEFNEVPDDQIQAEIERIMSRVGLAREADAAAEAGVSVARAEKANGKAQDPNLLPGNGPAKTGTLS